MNIKDYIIIILLILLGWLFWTTKDNTTNMSGSSFEQIESNVVRAETEVVDEVDTTIIKSEKIKERVKDENINLGGNIETSVGGNYIDKHANDDSTTKKYSWQKKDLYWTTEEGQKFPIGSVMWSERKQQWKGVAYKLNFSTNIVQQQNYDGSYETFIETFAVHNNLKEKHGGGAVYPVQITSSNFQIKRNNVLQWSFWNPTISIGLITTGTVSGSGLKLNVINYGYDSGVPVYQFLSPVVFASYTFTGYGLEIASLNIGEFVPLIKDLHIGLVIDTNKKPLFTLTSVF